MMCLLISDSDWLQGVLLPLCALFSCVQVPAQDTATLFSLIFVCQLATEPGKSGKGPRIQTGSSKCRGIAEKFGKDVSHGK